MMNQTTKEQTFFKPTKRKIILPLIFLLLPLTLFLISVPYLGYFFVLLLATLCIPFNPLLERLHLVIGAPGWFDMMGGPSLGGIIVVMIIYAAIAYFIICLLAYVTRKNPDSPLSANVSSSSRSLINRHPIATVVVIIIIAIGGLCYFYKIPQQILDFFSQNNTANWKTYVNEKYHYSFKYPKDCAVHNEIPSGQGGGKMIKDDFVIISSKEEKRRPRGFYVHITIAHTDTSFFNPPPGTNLTTWLKEEPSELYRRYNIPGAPNFQISGLRAVKIDMQSPQSGSQSDVLVLKDSELFRLNMMGLETKKAKEFYNQFLATFQFTK